MESVAPYSPGQKWVWGGNDGKRMLGKFEWFIIIFPVLFVRKASRRQYHGGARQRAPTNTSCGGYAVCSAQTRVTRHPERKKGHTSDSLHTTV